MIVLPGRTARGFASVLRRCRARDPVVLLHGGRGGPCVEANLAGVALRLGRPGKGPGEVLAFPASVLGLVASAGDATVTIEPVDACTARMSWQEESARRCQELGTVEHEARYPFPSLSPRMRRAGGDFLSALHEASATTASSSGRALDGVLLRGGSGEVVASDGRQLLVWGGFTFAWEGDVLLPSLGCWNSRELPKGEAQLGREGDRLLLKVGDWSFALALEANPRYPDIDPVIPSPRSATSRLSFGPEALTLLQRELPRLAREAEGVRLHLGRGVRIEALDEKGRPTKEMSLPDARAQGKPCPLCTDARLLLRALRLGFTEVEVGKPQQPLCCRDATRTFVWMPLALPDEKEETTMTPRRDENRPPSPPEAPEPPDPVTEAETLRVHLAQAQTSLGRLLSALRKQRRQTKAVRQAVASLRELPPL